MKNRVCTHCGFVGKPGSEDGMSYFVDFFVWLMVFSIAMITGIFPLVVLAPVFSLFHFFRFHRARCPKCENLNMVSVSGKVGRALLRPHEGSPQPWSDTSQRPVPH